MNAIHLIPDSMRRLLTRLVVATLGIVAVQQAGAFTTTGPLGELSWQTTALDYGTRFYYGNDIELGGPRQFGEASRLNVPIITYGFDYTFLNYFGSQGVTAVTAAMNEMNSLPAASSANLKRFITQDNQAINYTAEALSLTDIKSLVMSLMIEHMGLMGESHVWDLDYVSAASTNATFGVINDNFDPVTFDPTPYVNGVLYNYTIFNNGTVADAIEETANQASPAQFSWTAVATRYGQKVGGYYLGITRDDMGGLRYLYRRNFYQQESLDSNSVASFGGTTWAPFNPTATNAPITGFEGVLGGVEKITYVRVNYNSLIGPNFTGLTNHYTIPMITNGQLVNLHVARGITQPDIIFAAAPLGSIPITMQAYPAPVNFPIEVDRNFTFTASTAPTVATNAPLPAVINAQEIITLNNETPAYINTSSYFLTGPGGQTGGTTTSPVLVWGSFNGTTNAPIVFPNGSSVNGLEEEILSGSSAPLTFGTYDPISVGSSNTTAKAP